MRGKRGHEAVIFLWSKNTPLFKIYFCGIPKMGRASVVAEALS
jgi:hypothetical protein